MLGFHFRDKDRSNMVNRTHFTLCDICISTFITILVFHELDYDQHHIRIQYSAIYYSISIF